MINCRGKIVGVFLGVLFLHPLGFLLSVIVGLFFGHLWDKGWFGGSFSQVNRVRNASNVQEVFFSTTFATLGYLAKSDGRVTAREIQAVEAVMARFHLIGEAKRSAIDHFNRGKQSDFDLSLSLRELKQVCWFQPSLLRTFLEIQIQIAYVDGTPEQNKREALRVIFSQLGLSSSRFDGFERQYQAGQNYQRHSQGPYRNSAKQLSDAYALLGVTSSASDAEVKKAYRKMMSQHHPDRLMSRGVPEKMIKIATEKTQQIKAAYETIKVSRGIK